MKNTVDIRHEPHASVSYLQAFLDRLSLSEIEKQSLLIQAGIKSKCLQDPDAYIPLIKVSQFLALAMSKSRQYDLGLQVGLSTHPVHWGQLATLMFSSATLGEALSNTVDHEGLVNNGLVTRVEINGQWVEHQVNVPDIADPELSKALVERDLSALFVCAGFLLNEKPMDCIKVKKVYFQHAKPTGDFAMDNYLKAFSCEPEFLAPYNKVIYHKEILDQKIKTANPNIMPELKLQISKARDKVFGIEQVKDRVYHFIKNALLQGAVNQEACAQNMGISISTLKRRLSDEGTSFRAIVDQVRQKMATELLLNESMSLTELGLMLGFSNASAFNNAFKKWTGLTPLKYRQQHKV